MFKKKSMETVLKEIYEAYPDAFADGQRLSGLIADFPAGSSGRRKNNWTFFWNAEEIPAFWPSRTKPLGYSSGNTAAWSEK